MTELQVSGMTCGNCARRVTDALQAVPGVRSATLNLQTRRVSVHWHSDVDPDAAKLLSAVKAAGYDATALEAGASAHSHHHKPDWHLNLWVGGIVTASLMLGEWVLGLGMAAWFQWTAFALAGVVQFYCGAEFYRGAWRQLRQGSSSMDTLVALGSTTAFGFSAWVLLSGAGGHVYFMEAAAIITLISIGHWLEARVSERASGALKSLLQLAPATARRIQSAAPEKRKADLAVDVRAFSFSKTPTPPVEVEVPVTDLRPGDHVALRPGDHVPVDGMVTEGDSSVNEAMLTGESAPVDKSPGAELYAGTVNLNGRLVMRVTATGEATALANIIAAVQRAQTSRADIQRLGDQVSNVFVPVVVVIALVAGLWWGLARESAMNAFATVSPFLWAAHPPAGVAAGFIVAAAVLIVACPCAMGLATPAAIMAGANAAARRGILIRDGVALEKAGKITAVVFDKTGTLTTGELAVVGPWTPDGSEAVNQLACKLARSLARHSSHPISKVLSALSPDSFEVQDWREISGAGVQAGWQSPDGGKQTVRLGSIAWLNQSGLRLPDNQRQVEEWKDSGATLVGLAVGDSLAAVFGVRDFLKPGTNGVVRHLTAHGLNTFLLTGDNARVATGLARQVGIAPENVFAEVRPEQKAEFIKKLQARGEQVAFVGDGINDAPALTQADLGIAVGRASDVAREAADIILLKSEIEAVPEALGLAQATLRTIKQNLFWAFFYNAIGVPLAVLGFISPVLCAAAMGLSDLVVVGNALRLARWRAG